MAPASIEAGAVEETGVDENHPGAGGADARREVECRAALFVHDADLHRIRGQAERGLDVAENIPRERDLVGPVHLGFHDVDAARARIGAAALHVVQAGQAGEHRVQHALGNGLARGVEHGVGEHMVADIAGEEEAASRQRQLRAVGRGVGAVGVEGAVERAAALHKALAQLTAHEAEPVTVNQRLVRGVHGGHRVLEVLDRGHGGFEHEVLDARRIVAADRVPAVNLDFDVQTVMAEQHNPGRGCRTLPTLQLAGIGETGAGFVRQGHGEFSVLDQITDRIAMAAGRERGGLVEKIAGEGDHGGAAAGIVGGGDFAAVLGGNGVGAVERVVEAAPAGVGGVERVAGVVDGHHQLRARDGGDFRVDAPGLNFEILALGQQVTDLLQEPPVGCGIVRLAGPGPVPGVDFALQLIASGQELAEAGRELCHHAFQRRPEGGGRDAGADTGMLFDEVAQHGRDLQAAKGNPGSGGHEGAGCG